MSIVAPGDECEVHYHLMGDGRCTCPAIPSEVELPIALGVALNTGRPELLEHYTGHPAISTEATHWLVRELLSARETITRQNSHIGELTRKLERARRFLRKLCNTM